MNAMMPPGALRQRLDDLELNVIDEDTIAFTTADPTYTPQQQLCSEQDQKPQEQKQDEQTVSDSSVEVQPLHAGIDPYQAQDVNVDVQVHVDDEHIEQDEAEEEEEEEEEPDLPDEMLEGLDDEMPDNNIQTQAQQLQCPDEDPSQDEECEVEIEIEDSSERYDHTAAISTTTKIPKKSRKPHVISAETRQKQMLEVRRKKLHKEHQQLQKRAAEQEAKQSIVAEEQQRRKTAQGILHAHQQLDIPTLPLFYQRRFVAEFTRMWRSCSVAESCIDVPSRHPDTLEFDLPTKRPPLPLQLLSSDVDALDRIGMEFDVIEQTVSERMVHNANVHVVHCTANNDASVWCRSWSDGRLTIDRLLSRELNSMTETTSKTEFEPFAILDAYGATITASSFSSSTTHLLTASSRGGVLLWNIQHQRKVCSYQTPHSAHDMVTDVTFCPRDTYFATACIDGSVDLWITDRLEPLRHFQVPLNPNTNSAGAAQQVLFHPSYRYMLIGSSDGAIRLWDIATARIFRTLVHKHNKSLMSPISHMALSSDGTQLASTDRRGTLSVWDLASGKVLSHLTTQLAPVQGSLVAKRYRVVWAHFDPVLAHVDQDGSFQCIDTKREQPVTCAASTNLHALTRPIPPVRPSQIVCHAMFTTRNVLVIATQAERAF